MNVSTSVLWCCESWNLSILQKRRLQTVERSMLRRFAAGRRRPAEEYIDWIRRATREAETARNATGLRSWPHMASFRKWSWAGHVARMQEHRWASRMSSWRDAAWWAEQNHQTDRAGLRPMRPRPGHFSRWETELSKFALSLGWGQWRYKAKTLTTAKWNSSGHEFARWACKSISKAAVN